MRLLGVMGVVLSLPLTGCQSMENNAVQRAVLLDTTDATHATLSKSISAALNDRPVRIARSAFSTESLLTVETPPRAGIGQTDPSGLVLERPEQFRLLKTSEGCELEHVKTGQRYPLPGVRCRPESVD